MITQTMDSVFWFAWILTAAFMEISKTAANKTIIQACINGVLTLSCKAVKHTDTNYEVQWKIQFPGTNGWMEFFYCQHKSNIHCYVQIPKLPEGLTVLHNPDGNATLERSERNAVQDHAQIACQVHGISDHSLQSHHLYEVNFTIRCVWIEQGHNLNLTKTLLMNEIRCAHVVEIGWYDGNGTEFAYCNSCQRCLKTNNSRGNHPVPAFWNRVKILSGSLLVTAIQDRDNKSKIMIKIHSKTPIKDVEKASAHTIEIFVYVSRGSPVTSAVKTSSVQSTSRVTSQADFRTTRSSLPSSRPSHSGNLSVTPSSVASLHSRSLKRNGASASNGQLWILAVIAATGFLCVYLR